MNFPKVKVRVKLRARKFYPMSTVGERIKLLRDGLSQKQLAEQLSIPQTTLSNYETNRSQLNLATIAAISTNFGATPDWLLFGSGPMKAGETATVPAQAEEKEQDLKKRIAELEREKERLEQQVKALAEENKLVWEMRLSREKDVECYREDIAHYKRVIDGLMQQLQQLVSKGEPITGAPVSATSAPLTSLTGDE